MSTNNNIENSHVQISFNLTEEQQQMKGKVAIGRNKAVNIP
jgi:hypothetical protein